MFQRRRSRAVLQQGALWASAVTALLLFIVVVAGVWQFWRLQASLDRQALLVDAVVSQRDALLQLVNEETGVRGYVATGDDQFLKIYYDSRPQEQRDAATIVGSMAELRSLQPAQAWFHTDAATVQNFFDKEIRLGRAGGLARARANLPAGKALFDRLRMAEAVGESSADAELQSQRAQTRVLAQLGFFAGLVICGVFTLFAIAFVLLLRRTRAYRMNALRDVLTGAVNRRGAIKLIEELIGDSTPFGLVFIDLDEFKKINDGYGHATGDAILQEVSLRLRSELREGDEVCRLGGDEFVCVVVPPTSMDQLRSIASRLGKAIGRPYSFQGEHYVIGCSVGMSLYPRHGKTVDTLLESADDAMYRAKAAGGGIREATLMAPRV